MAALYVVLPLALIVVAVAVGVFVWAARDGQFDDLETPAYRVLFDDVQSERVRSEQLSSRAGQNDIHADHGAREHVSK